MEEAYKTLTNPNEFYATGNTAACKLCQMNKILKEYCQTFVTCSTLWNSKYIGQLYIDSFVSEATKCSWNHCYCNL